MDIFDQATEREERDRAAAIAAARAGAAHIQPPKPRGFCFNCEARLPSPLIYCDDDCAHDHRQRKQRGQA